MSDTQSSDPHQKPFVKIIYSVGIVSAIAFAVGLVADLASLINGPLDAILIAFGAVTTLCAVGLIIERHHRQVNRNTLRAIGSLLMVTLAGVAIGAGVRGRLTPIPSHGRAIDSTVTTVPSLSVSPSGSSFAFCSGSPRPSAESPPAGSGGRICSPADGSRVQQAIEVTGEATNVPAGHELWLFVDPAGMGRFLPANGEWNGEAQFALSIDSSGAWGQGDVELGAVDDKPGGKFFLVLVDLGPEGVKRMESYFANRETDGIEREQVFKFPGTRRLDSIKLERA